MSITAVVTDIVLEVIERIRGNSSDITAKNVADIVADKVLEAVAVMIKVELEKHAAALGMVIATRELVEACEAVLSAIREAERAKPTFGSLPVEIVTEITDEDRAREQATWDNLKTPPPEGSSER